MPIHIITFNFPLDSLNTSLQVGDTIYHVPTTNPTAVNTYDVGDLSNVQEFGVLTAIAELLPIGFTLTVDSNISTPVDASYIMFAKDKKANTTSLSGYYADVKFVNNSKEKAELFSVGSEITESSK
jgi:hypothetical protein|tara:strand:- start:2032 stop:2409 length:378 start_codon:yes stop_codon:yes gene_type:complete